MMERLLPLLFLLGVAFAGSLDFHTAQISKKIGISAAELQRKPSFSLQTAPDCATAITNIQTLTTPGGTCNVFDTFDGTTVWTEDELNTRVTAHCAPGGCRDQFEAALDDIIALCPDVAESDISFWLLLNGIPCIEEAGANCYVPTKLFLQRLEEAETNPLQASDLDAGCTTCLVHVVRDWISFEARPEARFYIAYLDFICLKRDGVWCNIKFQELSAAFDAQPAGDDDAAFNYLVDNAATFCHECNIAFLNAYLNLVGLAATWADPTDHTADAAYNDIRLVRGLLTYICVKDGDVFCSQKVKANSAAFDALKLVCAPQGLGQPCPGSDCQDALKQTSDFLGCCLGSLFDFFGRVCEYQLSQGLTCDDNANSRFLTETLCQVDVKETCAWKSVLILGLAIENLAFDWCTANWIECKELIVETLTLKLGIEASSLEDALIESDADPQSSPTRRRLLTASTDSTVRVTVTGITSDSGVFGVTDPSGGVFVQDPKNMKGTDGIKTSTTLTTETSTVKSGAGMLVPSFFLLLVSLALSFFM